MNYLILIDEVSLLPALFQQVIVPPAVALELQHPKAPPTVRSFIEHRPEWLTVQAISHSSNPALADLGAGEREAIELALELGHGLLIDDAEGRRRAEALGLEPLGTLGVLELAAKQGKLDLRDALQKLASTNIRLSPALVRSVLLRVESSTANRQSGSHPD